MEVSYLVEARKATDNEKLVGKGKKDRKKRKKKVRSAERISGLKTCVNISAMAKNEIKGKKREKEYRRKKKGGKRNAADTDRRIASIGRYSPVSITMKLTLERGKKRKKETKEGGQRINLCIRCACSPLRGKGKKNLSEKGEPRHCHEGGSRRSQRLAPSHA